MRQFTYIIERLAMQNQHAKSFKASKFTSSIRTTPTNKVG